MSKYITASFVADDLGCNIQTISKWCRDGFIESWRNPTKSSRWKIRNDSYTAFKKEWIQEGVSREELAQRLDITESNLAKYISNKKFKPATLQFHHKKLIREVDAMKLQKMREKDTGINSDFMNSSDTATYLNISRERIVRMCKSGDLQASRDNGKNSNWKVKISSIQEFEEKWIKNALCGEKSADILGISKSNFCRIAEDNKLEYRLVKRTRFYLNNDIEKLKDELKKVIVKKPLPILSPSELPTSPLPSPEVQQSLDFEKPAQISDNDMMCASIIFAIIQSRFHNIDVAVRQSAALFQKIKKELEDGTNS